MVSVLEKSIIYSKKSAKKGNHAKIPAKFCFALLSFKDVSDF